MLLHRSNAGRLVMMVAAVFRALMARATRLYDINKTAPSPFRGRRFHMSSTNYSFTL